MAMMKLRLFYLILFFTCGSLEASQEVTFSQRGDDLNSQEFCNTDSTKCQLVGSAGPWLLSIFETSVEACKASGITSLTVRNWLNSNYWLVEKVKKMTSEYGQFIKMQKNYWNVPSPYLKSQCLNVSKAVEEVNPLNHGMR